MTTKTDTTDRFTLSANVVSKSGGRTGGWALGQELKLIHLIEIALIRRKSGRFFNSTISLVVFYACYISGSNIAEIVTRSSAIAEGPRDALCQLKSCQLPCNSAELNYLYDKS